MESANHPGFGLSELDVENDRFMICGSPSMLKDKPPPYSTAWALPKEARWGDMGQLRCRAGVYVEQ